MSKKQKSPFAFHQASLVIFLSYRVSRTFKAKASSFCPCNLFAV